LKTLLGSFYLSCVLCVSEAVNLALGRPTFQINVDWGKGPSLAVDGNRSPSIETAGSCIVTTTTTRCWWAVDLGIVVKVTEVHISQSDQNGM